MSLQRYHFKHILFVITLLLYVFSLIHYFSIAQWSWYTVPVILYAWFSADFVLGLTHFYLDYVQCPRGIGLKNLIHSNNRSNHEYSDLKTAAMKQLSFMERVSYDFKTHHLYPNALGTRTFLVLEAESMMTHVIPVLIFLLLMIYLDLFNDLMILYFLVLSLGFLLGQYAHACTHKKVIPLPVQWLQKMHIFLTIETHTLHHTSFKESFCVLNGWSNFLINPLANYMLQKKWIDPKNLELN
jgi:hypothetical protein